MPSQGRKGRTTRSSCPGRSSTPDKFAHAGAGSRVAVDLPGPLVDAYGAGDSFAAGLTFALGSGRSPEAAVEFAAKCGAVAMTRRGAHGNR